MKITIMTIVCSASLTANAQLYIERGADLHLQNNAGLFVQGDINANASITGSGTIYISGEGVQSINMNGFSIPRLSLQNKNAESGGDLTVKDQIDLNDVAFPLNKFNLGISEGATVFAQGAGGIVTNSTGMVRKHFSTDVIGYTIPLVNGNGATPVVLSTKGKYHNGYVELSSIAKPSANKPSDAEEYLNNHWKVNRYGIEGSVEAFVKYDNLADLDGYVWNNRQWNEVPDVGVGIRANIESDVSELYAMQRTTQKISLTPNPAYNSTLLTFTSAKDETNKVVMTDLRGRIVKVQNVALVKGLNRVNIFLPGVATGYYNVTITQDGVSKTLKLIKSPR
jgi:hypothetical protein